jgi:hypothetical protein
MKKAHTVSSVTADDLYQCPKPALAPNLVRRRTDLLPGTESKTEIKNDERRKSILAGETPVRKSWREKKMPLRLQARDPQLPPRTNGYVDAAVQTENIRYPETKSLSPRKAINHHNAASVVYIYVEPRNPISIGSMQDFCRRKHYSLGDALGYV